METITFTGKIWKAGKNTLVLTMQRPVIEALKIKAGTIIQATIMTTNKQMQIQTEPNKTETPIKQPEQNQLQAKLRLRR